MIHFKADAARHMYNIGYTAQDIANIIGCSEATIRNRMKEDKNFKMRTTSISINKQRMYKAIRTLRKGGDKLAYIAEVYNLSIQRVGQICKDMER